MTLRSFLSWPFRLLKRFVLLARAAHRMEPLNSHPGRVIPDGVPRRRSLAEVPEKLPDSGVTPIGAALRQVFVNLQSAAPFPGLSTGFFELDDLIEGLQPGRLYVIAGAPSMGKTSLALALTRQVALGAGKPVLYFSMEMPAPSLALQLICTHAGIDASRVRRGRLAEEEFQRLISAAGAFHEAQVFVDDSARLSLDRLRDRARRSKEKEGIALILVDYLQVIEARREEAPESRADEVHRIVSTLKRIARELDLPVVALSALGRGPHYRDDHWPRCMDFMESSACMQEADVVALLYRDRYYFPDRSGQDVCEVILAKNRTGPTGVVRLAFEARFMRIENLA